MLAIRDVVHGARMELGGALAAEGAGDGCVALLALSSLLVNSSSSAETLEQILVYDKNRERKY